MSNNETTATYRWWVPEEDETIEDAREIELPYFFPSSVAEEIANKYLMETGYEWDDDEAVVVVFLDESDTEHKYRVWYEMEPSFYQIEMTEEKRDE